MKKIYYLIIILICFSAFLLAVFSIFHNDNDVLVKNSTIKEGIKIEEGDSIILEEGLHRISDNLVIPEGKTLIIKPGANLKIAKEKKIIVNGKIIAKGTENNPIIFEGDGDYWRGIIIEGNNSRSDMINYRQMLEREKFEETNFISSIEQGNVFSYCRFKDLATKDKGRNKNNRVKAIIEVNNAPLRVSYSEFNENIYYIGCIQPTNSLALINNNEIKSKMIVKAIYANDSVVIMFDNLVDPRRYEYETWPDGIVVNNGVGIIVNNTFDGTADDAIDFGGSYGIILNNSIKNTFDDGLDIDNGSFVYVIDNNISKIRDEALMISDQSIAIMLNNTIENTNSGLTLRSGSTIYSKNLLIDNTQIGIKFLQEIPLVLSQNKFRLIKEKISNLSNEDIWMVSINAPGKYPDKQMENGEIYKKNGDAIIASKETLTDIFDKTYSNIQGLKVLNSYARDIDNRGDSVYLSKPLRKVFNELIDVKKIQTIEEGNKNFNFLEEKNKNQILKYNNKLFLENSIINSDVEENMPFNLIVKNSEIKRKKIIKKQFGLIETKEYNELNINDKFEKANQMEKYIKNLIQNIKLNII